MIQPDEYQHHTIWTPELVEIDLPLAGAGRRVMAMMIDQFILNLLMVGVWIGFFITIGLLYPDPNLPESEYMVIGLMFCGMLLLTVLGYITYFWGFHTLFNGQTIGKKLVGIRLVTDRGGQPSGLTCFIRAVFDLLDFALFSGGVSVIMILMTEREKRIADFAAGTIVIINR